MSMSLAIPRQTFVAICSCCLVYFVYGSPGTSGGSLGCSKEESQFHRFDLEGVESSSLLQVKFSAGRRYSVGQGMRLPAKSLRAAALPDTYHSASGIIQRLEELASDPNGCPSGIALTVERRWDNTSAVRQPELFIVRLGAPAAPKTVLMVANEHAREPITAEVALRFIEDVCESTGDTDAVRRSLEDVRFTIIPVANAAGRKLVDSGENPCQRYAPDEGEGETDLNRNMDVDFQPDIEKHGPAPFSAYQSRIIRDLAMEDRPLAYLDLHSGARSLMVSWGDKRRTTPDFLDQQKLLLKVQEQWCSDCEIGSNRVVIDYPNPGEIIDHMYAKQGVKYATLWEVWRGPEQSLGAPFECTSFFNPGVEDFERVVSSWAGAIRTLADFVHHNVSRDERSNEDAQRLSVVPDLRQQGVQRLARKPTHSADFLTT